ncbi:copper resistance protein CopC [Ruania zhangjianzhongii]|uniref:copper resistance CopC family protein n=1 Tax=Ruania zhangjianzhongii TaxID=2603206 RepID=UPI0011C8F045|nr:copper resistance CopC family protein [Ruania zhangjianzhongii]
MALHSAVAHQRPTFRLLPLLALATFGALLLAGLTALPAAAHSSLLSSTPEDGAELDEAPDAVVLTFNENITDLGTDIVISGPDGEDAAGGETEIDGAEVTRQLSDELAAGQYSVTWRAVSADGHPIDGELTFTLTESAATGGAGAEEPTEEAAESEEPPSESPDDATASEDAGAGENGSDGSEGDQAEADASDAADAQAGAGTADDGGTSGAQIAIFVVIALAVIGGVTALIVRMRRQQ